MTKEEIKKTISDLIKGSILVGIVLFALWGCLIHLCDRMYPEAIPYITFLNLWCGYMIIKCVRWLF